MMSARVRSWLAVLVLGSSWGAATPLLSAELSEATHVEAAPIRLEIGAEGKIETMAMAKDGNLLVAVSWSKEAGGAAARPRSRPQKGGRTAPTEDESATRNYAIQVLDQDGKRLAAWPLTDVVPKMIHGCDDGVIYVGGAGKFVQLNEQGEILQRLDFGTILKGRYAAAHVSGMTANDRYFFVAFGDGWSLRATEDVVRFNRDLTSPKVVAEQLFGCCSHIDLDTKGEVLLIAENSRHRVDRYSFDGQRLGTWGQRDRTKLEGFAACCNPVNFDFGPHDVLYTAESGVGRVKKYSADGKFLGLVGYVDTTKFDNGSALAAQSCYIPIEVGQDAKRIFVMDVRAQVIRVLAEK